MKKFLLIFFLSCSVLAPTAQATLSCTVAASCIAPDVTVMKISSTAGGHAELSTGIDYTNYVCCSGVTGLGNLCLGTYEVVATLSGTSNAHIEQNTQTNYTQDVCLSSLLGAVTVAYQASNCTGYDATVASMSGTSNAHVGDASAYTTKICATVDAAQTLSFSISSNMMTFGSLSSASARYADSSSGSGTQTEAHTITASTNATDGYTITVRGATLTNGAYTITAIGNTNTGSSAGTEQFGLRATVTSGTGSVSSPYAASGFAYGANETTAKTLATGLGDSSSTVFSVRYLANIAVDTEEGSYSTILTYVATANF